MQQLYAQVSESYVMLEGAFLSSVLGVNTDKL